MSTKRVFRSVFESTDMIPCVIVPNCMATVEVIDQFEAQPHLYIKNYEEVRAWRRSNHQGYKMSSQRYAVAHLVASLRDQYRDQVLAFTACDVVRSQSPQRHQLAVRRLRGAARLRLPPLLLSLHRVPHHHPSRAPDRRPREREVVPDGHRAERYDGRTVVSA